MFPEYLIKAAEKALPHLIRCARVRKTITRTELASLVEMSPDLQLPRVLEALRQVVCLPRGLPDLTGIVVDAASTPDPDALERVYLCPDWDRLLNDLGITPLETQPKDLEEEGYAYTKYLSGNPAEEQASRELMDYVAENPQVLGLRTWRSGVVNHSFLTGDLCDVLFDRDGLPVIAVVATRHRGSQVLGIYRLIKLRALLEAEKGRGDPLAVQCYLTAQEVPADIRSYAARFQVHCVDIVEMK